MPARKTPDDYHRLAAERGFVWLGPEAENSAAKTWWQCSEGHKWLGRYSSIVQGHGCPHCAGLAVKVVADYYALAAKRGYTWLGPEVANGSTNTWWRCSKGHEFESSYANVAANKCGQCSANRRRTPADFEALAARKGFTWLGPEVSNSSTKTRWRCSKGHEWETTYTSARLNGCPHCSGKAQKTDADYLEVARANGFEWLGPLVATSRKTRWRCRFGHEWEGNLFCANKYGCPRCSDKKTASPEDYQALAMERGFVWLGPEVYKNSQRTRWRCPKEHEWVSNYSKIKQGYGCPFCGGTAAKTAGDYADLARAYGIFWLGPLPKHTKAPTQWQCQNGHVFETSYNRIYNKKNSCPQCGNRVNGFFVSNLQLALHKMLGGEVNHRVWRYAIDVALTINDTRIAVEYDGWYWHKDRTEQDAERLAFFLKRGWKVLVIQSAHQLPTKEQLDAALKELLNGASSVTITLSDWDSA